MIVAGAVALHHINVTNADTNGPPVERMVTDARSSAVLLVLVLGWLISRDMAKVAPAIFRRMDPCHRRDGRIPDPFRRRRGTVLGALAVGGISLQALAVGGAFTAVVLGLAAQQTLGNLFAGMVLLSARPFRLGERVRLQAGALAGSRRGVVSSLGLLYTTLSRGRGADHGPEQRRAVGRGGAAARAGSRRCAR